MNVSTDSVRDALGLVGCSLRNDREGAAAIKANADLGEVAETLAWAVAGLLRAVSPPARTANRSSCWPGCETGWPGKTGRDTR